MSLRIVHFSDPHGQHQYLNIPECDVLICSGDIGGRTNIHELTSFLIWFEQQPAKKKIFIAGNHDICLDPKWINTQKQVGSIEGMLASQYYDQAMKLIQAYDVIYLNNKDYVYEGLKFWGSPYTPSFHRRYWVFNADRGQEIRKQWAKIPSDVDVLITHGPVYGILDEIEDRYLEAGETEKHKGCEDLKAVIVKRLTQLKLHCSGHIHDNVGIILKHVTANRRVLFSNGAILTNDYKQLITTPLIINL